jgi:hypothetical protein
MALQSKELKSSVYNKPHPFQMEWIPAATQGGQPKLKVSPGLIGGVLATNWDQEFSVPLNGTFIAKFILSTNGLNIGAATIEIDSSLPAVQKILKDKLDSKIEFAFGIIKDGSITPIITTNMPGRIVTQYQLIRANSKPEAPSYDYYYRFELGC